MPFSSSPFPPTFLFLFRDASNKRLLQQVHPCLPLGGLEEVLVKILPLSQEDWGALTNIRPQSLGHLYQETQVQDGLSCVHHPFHRPEGLEHSPQPQGCKFSYHESAQALSEVCIGQQSLPILNFICWSICGALTFTNGGSLPQKIRCPSFPILRRLVGQAPLRISSPCQHHIYSLTVHTSGPAVE